MKSKKLVVIFASAAASVSLLLVSMSEGAKSQKVNAEYATSHSLEIYYGENAPTDLNPYQITDSGMNLHTGGYVYAQASRYTGLTTPSTLKFGYSNFMIVASGGKSGTAAANGILFDLWANGITSICPVFTDEAESREKVSSYSQKVYAYTDGGYPSAGTTAVESYAVDGVDGFPTSFTTAGINHVRIELKSVSTTNTSYTLVLQKISVSFSC